MVNSNIVIEQAFVGKERNKHGRNPTEAEFIKKLLVDQSTDKHLSLSLSPSLSLSLLN